MNHQVVDKYEKSRGVVNQDVVDFKTSEKFNLIVSISTLEHVGWDETPQDPEKIFTALDLLKSLLKPGGKLVVTIPVGQNPYLDSYIKNGQVKFTEEYHLLRVSEDNDWHEIDDFAGSEYGSPYPHANELYLGIYIK
jgi:cyclopropane fatty-acyl-phospholipid synthase-like methyltransferase